jgi:hypothetical protein
MRYFSAFAVDASTSATDVQHAAAKARQRDAAGLDLWGSHRDLTRLQAALRTGPAPMSGQTAGQSTTPAAASASTAGAVMAAEPGAASFHFRFFASDFPDGSQPLPKGICFDLCGFRARSGGAGQSLDASAWDQIAGQIAGHEAPLGYLDGALFAIAGADLPTELALIWAALHETIDELGRRAVPPETWTDRWVLRAAAGPNFFLELAKFRALRLGWNLLSSALPDRQSADQPLRCPDILGTALSWNLAASDAHNNLLRMTTEATAAMLGGADALSLPRFDAPLNPDPVNESDFSRRISDNLALLLDKESHLLRVDDPAAGSWYLEHLTDELGRQAWARFQQIEGLGGFTAALKSGEVQGWIAQARERKAAVLRQSGTGWIGVTRFRPAAGSAAGAAPAASAAETTNHNTTYGSSESNSSNKEAAAEPQGHFPPILPWQAEQELSPAAASDAHAPKTTAP